MNLSPHFTLGEMTASQAAARRGIDNTPSDAALVALRNLCKHILEPVREHFARPVRVSSGYRSTAVNHAIGGALTSQHCKGEAADFTVPGVTNLDLANWIKRNLPFDQLILEFYPGGWVHCSWRDGPLRGEALTATVGKTGTHYEPGLNP